VTVQNAAFWDVTPCEITDAGETEDGRVTGGNDTIL
jgi:hypothetical protein